MNIPERVLANVRAFHEGRTDFEACGWCSPLSSHATAPMCSACAADWSGNRERAKAEEAAGAAALQAREDAIREAELWAEADADAHRRDAERPCCGAAADQAKRDAWVSAGIGSQGLGRRAS